MAADTKRVRLNDSSYMAASSITPLNDTVFILLKTADREGDCPDWECKADTEVVGVYGTPRPWRSGQRLSLRSI